ncbi:MAG: hypothetical protein M3R32_00525 [Chloroflexota bacterium]|nr:hypothetical protein [Chloroflexota bacterium]
MPVTYDASFRLAVVALARIEGAYAAARMAHVSVNTVKSWMQGDEGQAREEDEWDAAQKLAQSRHLQALISGKVTGVGQWAMSAGISARNKRMVAVQRRWDARKAGEAEAAGAQKPEPTPLRIAVDSLSWDHRRLARGLIDADALDEADPVPSSGEPTADDQAAMLAWVEAIAALTPEQVATELAKLADAAKDRDRKWREEREQAARDRQAVLSVPIPPPSTPPGPSEPVVAPSSPPRPDLHVIPADEQQEFDDERHLWHRID